MKSVRVIDGVTQFVTQDIEKPVLRKGAARVRIEAAFLPPFFAGLPGGGWRTPPRPFTPGQCAIGILEELDSAIRHLRVGQRVYCDMYVEGTPGEAEQCFIGCFGPAPGSMRHLTEWPNGTFADEFVGPEHCFTAIPEGVVDEPEILCRLGWFATALEGFRRGGFRAGTTVAINGATGLLGTSAALVALAIGAGEVRLIGRRRHILRELAALERRLLIDDQGNAPLDFVLDCAGGGDTTTTIALAERLRRHGALVFVGALSERVAFDTSLLMRNGNALIGSFWFPHITAANVLALIRSGAIDTSHLRAECFPLAETESAMRASVERSGGLHHIALTPDRRTRI